MSQTTLPSQSDSLSLFNKVSWLVCTYGVGFLLVVILAISKALPEQSSMAGFAVHLWITITFSCGTYLLFPFWLYQRQVVQGKKLSFGWWFVLALYTGLLGGILIFWIFDVLRHIMKLIMKPQESEHIDFIYNGK